MSEEYFKCKHTLNKTNIIETTVIDNGDKVNYVLCGNCCKDRKVDFESLDLVTTDKKFFDLVKNDKNTKKIF